MALFAGDEEQLLVLTLALSISQVDLDGPNWTKKVILEPVWS